MLWEGYANTLITTLHKYWLPFNMLYSNVKHKTIAKYLIIAIWLFTVQGIMIFFVVKAKII